MKPMALMSIFNERKTLFNNHPDLRPFLGEAFGSELKEGTVIEIAVAEPGNEAKTIKLALTKSDIKFLNKLKELS